MASQSGEYILRTKDLSKKYGNNYAISNINVEIKRGQIYGLIGLNGAGKTTFMRTIAGLITPTSGEIELFEHTGTNDLQKGRSRIGQIIEAPAVYPTMTAEQNLEIQSILAGDHDKANILRILKLVGLSDTGKKKARDFSLGMKQRLALAIALVTNPEFLILDEPANGLDPMGIIEMRELMRHLVKERKLTILLSSHLLDELAQVATHYGIIHQGKLVKQLSASELGMETRQYIRIIANNAGKAKELLVEKFRLKNVQKVSDRELWIPEHTDKTGDMNTLLVRQGIIVESISVNKQRLEEYFMKLTGKITS